MVIRGIYEKCIKVHIESLKEMKSLQIKTKGVVARVDDNNHYESNSSFCYFWILKEYKYLLFSQFYC